MKRKDLATLVRNSMEESLRVKEELRDQILPLLLEAVDMLAGCLRSGHRVFLMGNGGSASDAQHMAAELIGRFEQERDPYPVVSLADNSSVLTALGNDYGYAEVFSRQVDALVSAGDVVICFSTSGESANVIRAAEHARQRGAHMIGFLGRGESTLAKQVDLRLQVPSSRTCRVQEGHVTLIHLICDALEKELH